MAIPRYIELVRVSGQQQAARDTPADQRQALDRLRVSRPGILVERIEEGAAGLSGALPLTERPDLQRLMVLAKARAFDEVRVRHLDRLTRHPDPRERYAIYGAVMDANAVIVDAAGHAIDPASEMGELDFAFNSIVAARERKRILERTHTARKRKAKEGKYGGRPPFGRTYDRKTRAWAEDAEQMATYRRIFKEVIAGRSLAKVAEGLNADEVPTPSATKDWKRRKGAKGGTGSWTSGIVGHLVKSKAATGTVTYMGEPMRCPPVVDEVTFKRARKAVAEQTSGRKPTNPADALLRGLAVCGACGAPVWVATGRQGGVSYRYYTCRWFRTAKTKDCRTYHSVLKVDAAARDALLEWLEGSVVQAAGQQPKQARGSPAALEAKLKALLAEEVRVLRASRSASAEAAEAILAELASEREALKRELEEAKLPAPAAPPGVSPAERAAMLGKARRAGPAELRALVQSVMRPGDARLLPGNRLELRPTLRLG
jgi:DNA invertase Pin-like site-specific DNA recombinase